MTHYHNLSLSSAFSLIYLTPHSLITQAVSGSVSQSATHYISTMNWVGYMTLKTT